MRGGDFNATMNAHALKGGGQTLGGAYRDSVSDSHRSTLDSVQ